MEEDAEKCIVLNVTMNFAIVVLLKERIVDAQPDNQNFFFLPLINKLLIFEIYIIQLKK